MTYVACLQVYSYPDLTCLPLDDNFVAHTKNLYDTITNYHQHILDARAKINQFRDGQVTGVLRLCGPILG